MNQLKVVLAPLAIWVCVCRLLFLFEKLVLQHRKSSRMNAIRMASIGGEWDVSSMKWSKERFALSRCVHRAIYYVV